MQSDLSLSYILRSSLSQVEEEAVRRACSLALAANVPLVVSAPSCPDVVAIIAEYQVLSSTVLCKICAEIFLNILNIFLSTPGTRADCSWRGSWGCASPWWKSLLEPGARKKRKITDSEYGIFTSRGIDNIFVTSKITQQSLLHTVLEPCCCLCDQPTS